MLGERLGEAAGRITVTRVLPSEGGRIKVEVSFQGQGQILGRSITDVGTYWQTVRPGGTLRGEGHVLMFTDGAAVLDWMGGGVGRPMGAGYKASYGVYGYFDTTPPVLGRQVGALRARPVQELDVCGDHFR